MRHQQQQPKKCDSCDSIETTSQQDINVKLLFWFCASRENHYYRFHLLFRLFILLLIHDNNNNNKTMTFYDIISHHTITSRTGDLYLWLFEIYSQSNWYVLPFFIDIQKIILCRWRIQKLRIFLKFNLKCTLLGCFHWSRFHKWILIPLNCMSVFHKTKDSVMILILEKNSKHCLATKSIKIFLWLTTKLQSKQVFSFPVFN